MLADRLICRDEFLDMTALGFAIFRGPLGPGVGDLRVKSAYSSGDDVLLTNSRTAFCFRPDVETSEASEASEATDNVLGSS